MAKTKKAQALARAKSKSRVDARTAQELADAKNAQAQAEAKAEKAEGEARAARADADAKTLAKQEADAKAEKTEAAAALAQTEAKAADVAEAEAKAKAEKAEKEALDAREDTEIPALVLADAELGGPIDIESFAHLLKDVSRWDEIRKILTGTGQYAGSGDFKLTSCDGNRCVNPKGAFSFLLNVDFGAKTVGGNCRGNCAASGAAFSASADNLHGGAVSDSLNIPTASFADLNGPALIMRRSESGNFSADIALKNKGGVPAADAEAAVRYFDGKTNGSGTATAPMVDCATGACRKK